MIFLLKSILFRSNLLRQQDYLGLGESVFDMHRDVQEAFNSAVREMRTNISLDESKTFQKMVIERLAYDCAQHYPMHELEMLKIHYEYELNNNSQVRIFGSAAIAFIAAYISASFMTGEPSPIASILLAGIALVLAANWVSSNGKINQYLKIINLALFSIRHPHQLQETPTR